MRKTSHAEIQPTAVYSAEDLGLILGVHPETVRKWHRSGALRGVIVGGNSLRWLGADVLRHLTPEPEHCTKAA